MKISCPKCPAVYELDESRIPAAGLSIKCPKCQTPFTVAKPKPGEAAVPLPSRAQPPSSKPAPPAAAAGSAPPPGRPPGAQQAVPLPGSQARAAAQPSAPPPAPSQSTGTPVPLPGQAGGARNPGAQPSAAPLAPPPQSAVPLPGSAQARAAKAAAPMPPAPPSSLAADPFADLDLNDTSLDNGPALKLPPQPSAPPPAVARPAQKPQPLAAPPPAPPEDDPFGLDLPPPPAAVTPPPPPPRSAPPPALAKAPAAPPPPALLPDDGGLSFDFIDEPKAPPPKPPAPAKKSPPASDLLDFVDDEPHSSSPAAAQPPPSRPPSAAPATAGARPAPPVMKFSAPPPVLAQSGSAPQNLDKTMQDAPRIPALAEEPAPPREPLGPKLKAALAPVAEKLAEAGAWVSHNKKIVVGAAGGLLVVLVVGLGVRASSTDSGLFWMHKLMPRSLANSAGKRAIDQAAERLAEGNFLATRSALGTAAQVLQTAPDDEEVRAFFVLCAAELKLMYGQAGGDWDLAQRTVEKLQAETMKSQRARAAFALATGDAGRAKVLLQPFIDRGAAEAQGIFLYARALQQVKEFKNAAALLDNSLKVGREPPPKLLFARAMLARAQGNLAEEATFLDRTLARQPGNGRAMIELADVKRRQDDLPGATELLDKALLPEQKKALDASEEARALLFRGQILAGQRQNAGAEAAFERAVELDPQSVDIRATYGAWRAARHEYERAFKHLEVALSRDSTNPAIIDPAARSLIGLGRPLDASHKIDDGLKKQPDDPVLLFLHGKVEEQFQRPEDALKSYEAALKKKPDHAESLIASGFILLSKADNEGAQKRLALAVASPDGVKSALVQLAIGDLELALGQSGKARESYGKALAIDPDDAQAHASMGRALAAMGDLGPARVEMEIALKTLEGDATLQYEYGSLLRRFGDRAAALPALQKAVKLAPNDHRIRARLGALLFEQGDVAAAEVELKQAALLSDHYSETYFFLGRVFAGKKMLPEAIEHHKRAIELEPSNAEFHFYLGVAFELTSQIADAIKSFATAAEKDPKLAAAYEHMGRDYMLQNVYEEAIASFSKAAALDSKRRPENLAAQADAEQQSGNVDAAIAHYRQALEANPRLQGVWSKFGVALKDKACNNCRVLAVQAFQRAEVVDPHDPAARRELGYVYKEDGKRAEAIAEFKKYIELKPDATDADQVRDDIYYLSEDKKRAP